MGRKKKKKDKRWGNEMVTTETLPKIDINPRWSRALLNFTTTPFWSPESENSLTAFEVKWNLFTDRLWLELCGLDQDALKREAFNHYMSSLATNTWQETNDCWDDPPDSYILQYTTVEELYSRLVGSTRTQYVWIDHLDWTCQFLKVKMP